MDKDTTIVDKDNPVLATFAEELKALLEKHNVAIEVQSQIVAVDLSKKVSIEPADSTDTNAGIRLKDTSTPQG